MQCSDKNVVCFDVDDTLVIWGQSHDPKARTFCNYGCDEKLLPHEQHIEQLKRHHDNGHFVIVWSQGGWEWALEVVTRLGLKDHVDLVCSKPMFYYDDINASEWMKRVFYPQKGMEE